MLFGGRARRERAEVAALAGLRIALARVEAELTGFELADHRGTDASAKQTFADAKVPPIGCYEHTCLPLTVRHTGRRGAAAAGRGGGGPGAGAAGRGGGGPAARRGGRRGGRARCLA